MVEAFALAQTSANRVKEAETELKEAQASVEQNLVGVSQPRRAGNLVQLIVRPQEVVAAVNALNQAFSDYYGAIGDFNRAQFQLYRALGQPAQQLLTDPRCGAPPSSAPADSKTETLSSPRKITSPNPETDYAHEAAIAPSAPAGAGVSVMQKNEGGSQVIANATARLRSGSYSGKLD